jgi:predicted kinase
MANQPLSELSVHRGRLIVVCGLPGAGKTTHARSVEDQLCAVRFSPDEWMSALAIDVYDAKARFRIEQLQWTLCERLLVLGLTAIVEWGTWARSERDHLRQRARKLGAGVELHYLFASEEILYARIRLRGAESPPISRGDLAGWLRQFEAPSREEKELFDKVVEIDGGRRAAIGP